MLRRVEATLVAACEEVAFLVREFVPGHLSSTPPPYVEYYGTRSSFGNAIHEEVMGGTS